jgi:hypothetical protein
MSFIRHLFGGADAKTKAEISIEAIAQVINDGVQNCSQQLTNEEFNNIRIEGTRIRDLDLNIDQFAKVKTQCLQSEEATTQLNQALQASATQTAKSLSQQLELSSAKSKDVIRLNALAATTIKNNFVQQCVSTETNQIRNNITVENSIIGELIINSDQYIRDLVSCSTRGQQINDITEQITATIEQEAAATVENFFTPFLIALAIIIGIIALFLFLPAIFRKKQTSTSADQELTNILLSDVPPGVGSTATGSGEGTSGTSSSLVSGITSEAGGALRGLYSAAE